MMTLNRMVAILETLSDDIDFEVNDNIIYVSIEDFGGAGLINGTGIKQYNSYEGVKNFLEMLEDTCLSCDPDYFDVQFEYDDFVVSVEYLN